MVVHRGEVFWVDLGEPLGSEPGFRRPVLVIQADAFNRSKLATVIVLSLTSNLSLGNMPGCVFLSADETGLPKNSVANASQIRTIDRARLDEYVGLVHDATMSTVDETIRLVLGL